MAEHALKDRFHRSAIELPFHFRVAGETVRRLGVGRTRDLSERGAWVELCERLAPMTELAVNLHALEESLWLAAKVAWVCPEPHEQPHLHGLFFARATPEQQQRVRALLVQQKPRHAARLFCTLAATCQRKGASCNTLPCETRDLSYGGVALRLPDPLPRGTQVRVTVSTVFGSVTADAQIVWGEPPAPRPLGAPFRHGLRFVRLGPSSDLPLRMLLAGVRHA